MKYMFKSYYVYKTILAIKFGSDSVNRLKGKVEKALSQFDGKDLSSLQEHFEKARKTLGDMGDWKNFATEPKYLELCEAMERLLTSKHHPDKRFAEMKALQQQWKALDHSDISDKYWPRFQLAADKVYQPCAEFFEQRHDTRLANLERRQQYVEQMRELLEATDWAVAIEVRGDDAVRRRAQIR